MRNHRLFSLLAVACLCLPAGALELEHQSTRDLVDFVSRAAAHFEQQGTQACEAFKQKDGEWLKGDSYIFVIGMDGETLCHPTRPVLEGRNILEIRDPDGKPIVQLFLRQLADDSREGWAHYLWPRPGQSVLTWKSTYVRRATSPDGDDYVVGSGAYNLPMEKLFVLDRVEEATHLIGQQGRAAFNILRDKAGGFLFLDAYVFVMSSDGVMLVNPAFPEMEGQASLDVQDSAGVYPGREMLKVLESHDEGWVSYLWPRPNEKKPVTKDAFVKKVEFGGEVLVVGAGVYRD